MAKSNATIATPPDKGLRDVSDSVRFVEAQAEHKALIERYSEDPRPRVQAYARERARDLAQHMAWEQRKAAGDVARRKRTWGEE